MEQLKSFATLDQPDERQRFFRVKERHAATFRPLDSADIYALAEQAKLHAGVPEGIRSHFAMAQNLQAYSWFVYPFNVAAELHGYISVEFALRTRFPNHRPDGLKALFAKAIEEGLLTATGFTYGRESSSDQASQLPEASHRMPVEEYVSNLVGAMRSLRNDLAHGSNMLHMKGGTALLVCSEVINQLFVPPSDA